MMVNKHKVKQSHCKETETAYVVEYIIQGYNCGGACYVKKTAFLWKEISTYGFDSCWMDLEDGALVSDTEQRKLGKLFIDWTRHRKEQKARKFRQELAKQVREELDVD